MAAINHDNGNGDCVKTKLEIDRRDWVKVIGVGLTLLGIMIPVMMYVFQTRADAIIEHAAIEKAAAVQKERARLTEKHSKELDGTRDKQIKDNVDALMVIHANQRTMMRDREIERWRIKALPAGLGAPPPKPTKPKP